MTRKGRRWPSPPTLPPLKFKVGMRVRASQHGIECGIFRRSSRPRAGAVVGSSRNGRTGVRIRLDGRKVIQAVSIRIFLKRIYSHHADAAVSDVETFFTVSVDPAKRCWAD